MFAIAAAAAENAPPRRPPSAARRLEVRLTVSWENQRLEDALRRLDEFAGIRIWRDRRVDPNRPVDYRCSDCPLGSIVQDLAAEAGCAATPFRQMVYFGPAAAGSHLAERAGQLRQTISRMPPGVRRRWMSTAPWQSPRLGEPRQLVAKLADEAGAVLTNPEDIPHDLWDAHTLPPLTVADRLVVLLAGFDLIGQLSDDGKQLTVIAAPESPPSAAAPVPPTSGGARRRPNAGPQGSERRFTLRVESQPLGNVLDQLADQLSLTIEWSDPQMAASARARRISCDVRSGDLETLLMAVLTPAELAGVCRDNCLRITPKRR